MDIGEEDEFHEQLLDEVDGCFEPLQFNYCFAVGRGLPKRTVEEPFALACNHQERYTFQSWMTGKDSDSTRVVSDASQRSGQHTIDNRSARASGNRRTPYNQPITDSGNRRVPDNQPITDSANRRARGNQSTRSSARIRVDLRTRSNLSVSGKQHARRNVERQAVLNVLTLANRRMLSPELVRR
ncbi:MAG: hypothetical protein IJI88_04450 [Atopobiaceae bacterium]|nr:hypothetical protein [Atopobiaceae bacterium]